MRDMKMTRREFCAGAAALTVTGGAAADNGAGGYRGPWKPGHFQIHTIYTGMAESHLLIFPDGTSMLLDCGDTDPHRFFAERFGPKELPLLPSEERQAGEWIARYVKRMNPHGDKVDYMFLSHFHADHSGGFYRHVKVRKDVLPEGEPYYLTGFALAAETLRFRHAIDRGWPSYDDPLPYPKGEKWMGGSLTVMRKVYRHLQTRDGLEVEKFRVGETGQIKMWHDPAAYPDFSVFNLCGSGKIAMRDGTIHDFLAADHAKCRECVYNENSMSLGNVFTYGKFRYYTAGDFTASDGRKGVWDGKRMNIESILAKACGPVSVAKANHHAGWSCPKDLVAALRPRVWTASVWWQLHCDKDTMTRLSDRTCYSEPRVLLPGVMCRERREKDAGMAYLKDVPEVAHTPSHIVIDVPPGGETYKVALLDPTDEKFRVKETMTFNS